MLINGMNGRTPLASLAEVSGLGETVVVVITKLGVRRFTARAFKRLLRKSSSGDNSPSGRNGICTFYCGSRRGGGCTETLAVAVIPHAIPPQHHSHPFLDLHEKHTHQPKITKEGKIKFGEEIKVDCRGRSRGSTSKRYKTNHYY